MSTSSGDPHSSEVSPVGRGPLRLNMAEDPGRNRLDGAWWPQTRDLEVELADLVDNWFPDEGAARDAARRVQPQAGTASGS